ncbi:unnamed protein product [Sympodiomycopsis kandeliae]
MKNKDRSADADLEKVSDEFVNLLSQAIEGQELHQCGSDNINILSDALGYFSATNVEDAQVHITRLSNLKIECDRQFRLVKWTEVHRCWRRLYTDVILLSSLLRMRKMKKVPYGEVIRDLDLTIIVAGTPGVARRRICLDMIAIAQRLWPEDHDLSQGDDDTQAGPRKKARREYATQEAPSASSQTILETSASQTFAQMPQSPLVCRASRPVTMLEQAPTLDEFAAKYSKEPFIVRGFASDWPALDDHHGTPKWSSGEYLSSIAGRGRVVPVEVGNQYTDEDWSQEIMSWQQFLQRAGFLNTDDAEHSDSGRRVYLAQHTLLDQFPQLQRDIFVPDYVYSCPEPDDPAYCPPVTTIEPTATGEQVKAESSTITSLWIGPSETLSPPHTDPYFNCFVQVVGKKAVWIAHPSCTPQQMYCYGGESNTQLPTDPQETSATLTQETSVQEPLTNLMTNTSQVPVFAQGPKSPLYEDEYPDFTDHVEPSASYALLQAGDLLFLPPKWWHSFKSLEKSISLSTWF